MSDNSQHCDQADDIINGVNEKPDTLKFQNQSIIAITPTEQYNSKSSDDTLSLDVTLPLDVHQQCSSTQSLTTEVYHTGGVLSKDSSTYKPECRPITDSIEKIDFNPHENACSSTADNNPDTEKRSKENDILNNSFPYKQAINEASGSTTIEVQIDEASHEHKGNVTIDSTTIKIETYDDSYDDFKNSIPIKIINMKGQVFVCGRCHYKTIHKRYYSHHMSVCQQQHIQAKLLAYNTNSNPSLVLASPSNISYVTPKSLNPMQGPQLLNTNSSSKIFPVSTCSTVRLISPKNIQIKSTADLISGANKVKVAPINLSRPALQLACHPLNTSSYILPKSMDTNNSPQAIATNISMRKISPVINYIKLNKQSPPKLEDPKSSQIVSSTTQTPQQPNKKRKSNSKRAEKSTIVSNPAIVNQTTFSCQKCTYRTDSQVLLQQHIENTHLPVYTCNYCSFNINDQYAIKRHLEYDCKNRPPKIFTCNVCNVILADVGDITNHFKRLHPEYNAGSYPVRQGYLPAVKLPNNGQNVANPTNSIGNKPANVTCPYCSFQASSTSLLDVHIRDTHPQPSVSGSQNNFDFKISTTVTKNTAKLVKTSAVSTLSADVPHTANVHSPAVTHTASTSGLSNSSVAISTSDNNLGDKIVTCPTCFLRVPSITVLEMHIQKSHTQPKPGSSEPLQCPTCGALFTYLVDLETHIASVHPSPVSGGPGFSGFKPVSDNGNSAPLDPTTPKQKINLKSIKANNLNHSKFQSLEFNTIDKECHLGSFVTKTVPHGRPRAETKTKNSNVSTNLQRKMDAIKSLPKEKNYQCQLCPFRTTTPFNLNRHVKKHHPEMVEAIPKANILRGQRKSAGSSNGKKLPTTAMSQRSVKFRPNEKNTQSSVCNQNNTFQLIPNRFEQDRNNSSFAITSQQYNIPGPLVTTTTMPNNDNRLIFISSSQTNAPLQSGIIAQTSFDPYHQSGNNTITYTQCAPQQDHVDSNSVVSVVPVSLSIPNIPVVRDKL